MSLELDYLPAGMSSINDDDDDDGNDSNIQRTALHVLLRSFPCELLDACHRRGSSKLSDLLVSPLVLLQLSNALLALLLSPVKHALLQAVPMTKQHNTPSENEQRARLSARTIGGKPTTASQQGPQAETLKNPTSQQANKLSS